MLTSIIIYARCTLKFKWCTANSHLFKQLQQIFTVDSCSQKIIVELAEEKMFYQLKMQSNGRFRVYCGQITSHYPIKL